MEDFNECSDELVFFVNGQKVVEKNADPEQSLLSYLRNRLRLTGTKLGCSEGGCGACTVMLSKLDRQTHQIRHYSVNACIAPLCSVHGLAVTTVEGIGNTATKLHPVQERLAKSHGSQCGFCTPGIVMSMYTLLRNNTQPNVSEMENALEGNLCRCTGYRPILDGFRSFTKDFQCAMGDDCCRNNKNAPQVMQESCSDRWAMFDPSQEPIFPSELQLSDDLDIRPVVFRSKLVTWYRPTSLAQLLELKSLYPHAKLVNGNTELGLEVRFKNMHYPILVAASGVPELHRVEHTNEGIRVGVGISLTQLKQVLTEAVNNLPEEKIRIFLAIREMLKWFASEQIRNVGTIAGNIMTASPIADLNPLLLASACQLTLASKDNIERTVVMNDEFFIGYRKTIVRPSEVLVSIMIPYSKLVEYFHSYKQAQRRDDDIAIVNAAFRVTFPPKSNVVQNIVLYFGGMATTTVSAKLTAQKLIGCQWDDSLMTTACDELASELRLDPGTPGGMEAYRNTLSVSLFFKFYLAVKTRLSALLTDVSSAIADQSASLLHDKHSIQSSQVYEDVPEGQLKIDTVGRPLPHLAAMKQTTGEAVYLDDTPTYRDELYLAVVISDKAHARLISVDASAALCIDGVVDFVSCADVPGQNASGVVIKDQVVFADEKVTFQGQIIGGILAKSKEIAKQAAKQVHIEYEELKPILTIKEAIAANSFLTTEPRSVTNGDVNKAFDSADHVVEGEVHVGGQEHFYMETHGCIAVPVGEDGEMEVISSTQNTSHVQTAVADTLGVPYNRITCKVKRIGGGFGGKEAAPALLATVVAVAANKHKVPIRCVLDRDEDMIMTGTRHPYYATYKVACTAEGVILAFQADLYANCGSSHDMSENVLERALLSIDNAYKLPSVKLRGFMCATNLASNTAFRGFGAPQAVFICEQVVEHIAATIKRDAYQIRELNLYQEGDVTYINQLLENCTARRCWQDVLVQSDFLERQKLIEEFNRDNRWKKRGISVMPAKFNVGFLTNFLNQAGALVHVYTDGSVLLTHAGVEMGQGLHTKMVQIASRVLRIDVTRIHISETSSRTVPNTSPTAGSMSSDLNGMAIKNACEKIMSALKPFMENNKEGGWDEWVRCAYLEKVPLSATGFYGLRKFDYDWKTNTGLIFDYYSFSAAVSEVEIDCLTGDHVVLRTDIVMDVGKSLNPAIDIGQVEGAFVQGYGWLMLEEMRYSPDGLCLTRGPGTYKIPSFGNAPLQMNVTLIKDAPNPRAVYSSKGIGEPPLLLSLSVFLATRNAIYAARKQNSLTGWFDLVAPATAERIRMACVDQFTQRFPQADERTYRPWSVLLS